MIIPVMIVRSPCFSFFFFFEYLSFTRKLKNEGKSREVSRPGKLVLVKILRVKKKRERKRKKRRERHWQSSFLIPLRTKLNYRSSFVTDTCNLFSYVFPRQAKVKSRTHTEQLYRNLRCHRVVVLNWWTVTCQHGLLQRYPPFQRYDSCRKFEYE